MKQYLFSYTKITGFVVFVILFLCSHTVFAANPQFLSQPSDCVITGDDFLYHIDTEDDDHDYVEITTDNLPSFLQLNTTKMVSTVIGGSMGYTDGSFADAQITHPGSIVFDASGDIGYLVDYDNHMIRKLDFVHEQVTTYIGSSGQGYQDGPVDSAQITFPSSMAIDRNDNIYFTEHGDHRIRKIDTVQGIVSTIAGSGTAGDVDGIGTGAQLQNPVDIIMGENENTLYFADAYNHKIKKVDLTNNSVTTIAGATAGFADGVGSAARFYYPYGIEIDAVKENLYVADSHNNRIRKIRIADYSVTTIAGNGSAGAADGIGTDARFHFPYDVEFHPDGGLYITDYYNNTLRRMNINDNHVATIAGAAAGFQDGDVNHALFHYPTHLNITSEGDMYISERGNVALRKCKTDYTIEGNNISTAGEFPFSVLADDNHGGHTEQNVPLRIGDGIFLSDMQDMHKEIPADENDVVVHWEEPIVRDFCGDVTHHATVSSTFHSGDRFSVGRTQVQYNAQHNTHADQKSFYVFVSQLPSSCSGTIGNTIWRDSNRNQKHDSGEKGIEGITVRLKDKDGKTIKKEKTDKKGKYTFTQVDAGTYTVLVDKEDIRQYVQTYDPSGAHMNNKTIVQLDCDDEYTKADFGFDVADTEMRLAKTGGFSLWDIIAYYVHMCLL